MIKGLKKLCGIILLGGLTLVVMQPTPLNSHGPLEVLRRGASTVYHYQSSDPVMIPTTYEEQDYELRGVWVATVFNLNMPQHINETQYKQAFHNLIDQVKANNMNAIFFQVRPMNDAFYDSDLAPFSRYLTGTEGQDPGWDVLDYFIDVAHENGIEFHAWMNPYRVGNSSLTKTSFLNTLHPDNFARQNPDLVVGGHVSNNLTPYILNPGEPAVKTYIRDVVIELMDRYPVDGVHFDDYFYPYSGISSDTHTYELYKEADQSIADFRRESVNDIVRGIKEDVDAHNAESGRMVRFGISPFGLWASGIPGDSRSVEGGSNTAPGNMSSYLTQYADSRRWVEEGWVHYIAPQVYWQFTHSTAPYADVVDWWADIARGTDVDVVIGHAISSAHSNNWLTDEITTQLRYNQKHAEITGSILYSAAFLHQAHTAHVKEHAWQNIPLGVWAESMLDRPTVEIDGILDGSVYRSDVTVALFAETPIYYRIDGGDWILYNQPLEFNHQGNKVLHAKTVDAFGNESLIRSVNITIEKVNETLPVIQITGDQINGNYVQGAVLEIESELDVMIAINHGNVGAWHAYTEPIVLNSTGNYFIRAKTVDAAGIESEEVNKLITVVQACYANPVITIDGEGNPPYYRNATVTITSDAPHVSIRSNGGDWQPYTEPLVLTEAGEILIEARNEDACKDVVSQTIILMTASPDKPTIDVLGAYDGRYYTEPVQVSIHGSAEATLMYRVHNGLVWSSWQAYSTPLELTANATYTVQAYAVDQAGNVSETVEERIRLNVPPREDNPFVIRNGQKVTYYQSSTPVSLPIVYTEKTHEVRAAWVATVFNIDVPQMTTEAQYKGAIQVMLDRLKDNHFNVVFFQVRPMNDAFYPSSYAPYSRFITGTEGVDPGFDVLEFVIEEAHKRGIELHAWLNPYRVSSSGGTKAQQLADLHEDNFARQNPHLVMQDSQGRLLLNPGENQVQAYLRNVIQELLANYAVDGIHFDDYFYSYSGMDQSEDVSAYERHRHPGQSLADWRRSNVDQLVHDVFHLVETVNTQSNRHVKFGISPFGIWQSGGEEGSNTSLVTLQSYRDQFADTKRWVEEGWLHYIIPQLYWEFNHSLAPFADLVDWWAALCAEHDVPLIIGQGLYRYADESWTDENELLEQLRYMSQYDIIVGSAMFSYRTLNSTHPILQQALDRLNNVYWTEAVELPWETDMVVTEPVVCDEDETLIDGVCVPITPEPCPPGTIRDGDACVPIEEDDDADSGLFGGCFSSAPLSMLMVLLLMPSILGIKWFKVRPHA